MSSIYNFHQVSDSLACAGQPTGEQIKQLAANQYQVVINLALHGGKYALPGEAELVAASGMEYGHIPVVFNDPQRGELCEFTNLMNLHTGRKVLVHCVANYRASAFTGLYLFNTGKLDREQTRSFVENIWQPDAVWQQFIDEMLE